MRRDMLILLVFLLLSISSCIFVPNSPEYPDSTVDYKDPLSLGDIMKGTGYVFQYGGYDELFSSNSGDIFTDVVGLTKSRSVFVGRLNTIVSQYEGSITVEWGSGSSGDFLSETDGFEKSLSIRDYKVILGDSITYSGRVEIRVRYSTNYKWQIIHWKEIENNDGRYSFFHPDFTG